MFTEPLLLMERILLLKNKNICLYKLLLRFYSIEIVYESNVDLLGVYKIIKFGKP